MLELNSWFFVLVVNFLVLLYVLNLILFKPLMRVFDERESTVTGALKAAGDMTAKKDAALSDMKQSLSEASKEARAAFEDLRTQGLDKQKALLAEAAGEAASVLEEARKSLAAEAGRERGQLKADVEKFSDEIVEKLVKV